MARSNKPVTNVVTWKLSKGEQVEFPIELSFIDDASTHTFELAVVEANNQLEQKEVPKEPLVNGAVTIINVRKPKVPTAWVSGTTYLLLDVVEYLGLHYELQGKPTHTATITPDLDAEWTPITLNTVYVEVPSTLGNNWVQKPMPNAKVYGFFELQVTEPANGVFQRTWKPVSGVIEIAYSPTDVAV
jgi:hypothetical protein